MSAPHRRAQVPPLTLLLVLALASVVAVLPFAIVLGAVEWRSDDLLLIVVALVAAFLVLFPLGMRMVMPRYERPT